MKLLDASVLYRWGAALRPLNHLDANIASDNAEGHKEIYPVVQSARQALSEISDYVIDFEFAGQARNDLDWLLQKYLIAYTARNFSEGDNDANSALVARINQSAINFEILFIAELGRSNAYHMMPKKGLNLRTMMEQGEALFPDRLLEVLPATIDDVRATTRCYACELYTAAAFHLHRVNEAVLTAYFDKLSGGAKRPNRNMGAYITALQKLGVGDQIVAALRDLKNFYRNPIAHPEDSVKDADEFAAMLGAVNTTIFHMLKSL